MRVRPARRSPHPLADAPPPRPRRGGATRSCRPSSDRRLKRRCPDSPTPRACTASSSSPSLPARPRTTSSRWSAGWPPTRRIGHGGTLDPFASRRAAALPRRVQPAWSSTTSPTTRRTARRSASVRPSTTDDLDGELTPIDAPGTRPVTRSRPRWRGSSARSSSNRPIYSAVQVGGPPRLRDGARGRGGRPAVADGRRSRRSTLSSGTPRIRTGPSRSSRCGARRGRTSERWLATSGRNSAAAPTSVGSFGAPAVRSARRSVLA